MKYLEDILSFPTIFTVVWSALELHGSGHTILGIVLVVLLFSCDLVRELQKT